MIGKSLKNREQGTGNRDQAPCPVHSPSFWRMGGKPLAIAGMSVMLLAVAGCRQDMQNQPKLIPQRGSEMFADHRGARPQVLNTVARGQLREDSYFYTGVVHILAATGDQEQHCERSNCGDPLFPVPCSLFPAFEVFPGHQYSTSTTETGAKLAR